MEGYLKNKAKKNADTHERSGHFHQASNIGAIQISVSPLTIQPAVFAAVWAPEEPTDI